MYLTTHKSIQHMHHIQTQPRAVPGILAVTTATMWKQVSRNSQNEAEYLCNWNICRHSGIHINICSTRYNANWQVSTSTESIHHKWWLTKADVKHDIHPYLTFHDDLTVIDGIVLKGRRIVIPTSLHWQVLDQLHSNHLGIEKTCQLACESIYLININANIAKSIKRAQFQQKSSKGGEKLADKIPNESWEKVGADFFTLNNINYLCIVTYHSKFPMVKHCHGTI